MIKTLATISGILGSTLVATNMGYQSYGFILFLFCSAKYAYDNIKTKNKHDAYIWTFYAMMDVFGCYRYFS